ALVSVLHSRAPSSLPVSRVLPSGLQATAQTAPRCFNGRPTGCPVLASHNRAVPSMLPVATTVPIRLKATASTSPACSIALPTLFPFLSPQSWESVPRLPVISTWLSGLKARVVTSRDPRKPNPLIPFQPFPCHIRVVEVSSSILV